jgi:TPP-dependent pyruvate/acetoin dehydrogenase alpha subunit
MPATMTEFASADKGFSLISNRKLLTLYNTMLTCRHIAQKAGSKQKNNKAIGTAESIFGHEAAAVGSAIDLTAQDTVAPTLWPDTALKAINPAAAVAASFPLATQNALAEMNPQRITLIFSSRKRTSQSSWLKALALAANENLPILFVSLDAGTNSIGVEAIRLNRKHYALPHINVDGDDVVAVYRVASEAITHARNGHGPTLIDCQLSASGDPIQNMQKYLIGKGLDPAEFA